MMFNSRAGWASNYRHLSPLLGLMSTLRLMGVTRPKMKKTVYLAWLVLACIFAGRLGFAQEPTECGKPIRDPQAPEYKIGRNIHKKEPTEFLLLISVHPQFFVGLHMRALADQLNRDFCKEPRI